MRAKKWVIQAVALGLVAGLAACEKSPLSSVNTKPPKIQPQVQPDNPSPKKKDSKPTRPECASPDKADQDLIDLVSQRSPSTDPTESERETNQLKYLIKELGASPDARDTNCRTALYNATASKREDFVKALLEYRADPTLEDRNQSTPLHVAAGTGSPEIVNLLIQYRADVNARKNDGATPLMEVVACKEKCAEVVKTLVENKADIEARDSVGATALTYAAERGHLEMAKALLALGANLETADDDGTMPLMHAVNGIKIMPEPSTDMVKFLIESKASLESRDRDGRNALDLAIENLKEVQKRKNSPDNSAEEITALDKRISVYKDAIVLFGLSYPSVQAKCADANMDDQVSRVLELRRAGKSKAADLAEQKIWMQGCGYLLR